MSEWMKSFVGCLLMLSVAVQMLPNNKYEQYVRLFSGFLLLVLIIRPVLKIGSADTYLEEKIAEIVWEQERLEKEIVMQSEVFEAESLNVQKNDIQEIYIQEIENVQVEVTTDD